MLRKTFIRKNLGYKYNLDQFINNPKETYFLPSIWQYLYYKAKKNVRE